MRLRAAIRILFTPQWDEEKGELDAGGVHERRELESQEKRIELATKEVQRLELACEERKVELGALEARCSEKMRSGVVELEGDQAGSELDGGENGGEAGHWKSGCRGTESRDEKADSRLDMAKTGGREG